MFSLNERRSGFAHDNRRTRRFTHSNCLGQAGAIKMVLQPSPYPVQNYTEMKDVIELPFPRDGHFIHSPRHMVWNWRDMSPVCYSNWWQKVPTSSILVCAKNISIN
jgi:hypothetical protein